MTDKDRINQIKKYEIFADQYPLLYKSGVVFLALLGYLFIALVVFCALSLSVMFLLLIIAGKLIFIKLLIPFIILLFGVVRSLWVKFSPPEGLKLDKETTPELFNVIENIRIKLNSPKIHEVLLNEDYNAAIVQYPRLGIFGWYKNYLVLGYPLMQALSPLQFESVLGHELGHVSKSHGRIGSWIYRLQSTWLQLNDYFQNNKHWSNAIIRGFFSWFFPVINAYSFVLRRRHEYEADQASASVVGSRCAADALLNINLKDIYLSKEFWPNIFAMAYKTTTLPQPYTEMEKSMPDALLSQNSSNWLNESIEADSNYYDVHPSLAQRLKALQEKPRIPDPVLGSAAHYFLEQRYTEMTSAFDLRWMRYNGRTWNDHFQEVKSEQAGLEELKSKHNGAEEMNGEDMIALAWLTEKYESPDDALEYYRAAQRIDPQLALASFHIGRLLLEKGMDQTSAINLLEKAMKSDHELIIPGNRLLYDYYINKDLLHEADKCQKRAGEHARILQLAEEERKVYFDRNYIFHDLPTEFKDQIVKELSKFPDLKEAYLVKRKVKYLVDQPMYVLFYTANNSKGKNLHQTLMDHLASQMDFPWEHFYLVHLNWDNRKLNHIKKIKGALIYSK